jgi:hypothetical protein
MKSRKLLVYAAVLVTLTFSKSSWAAEDCDELLSGWTKIARLQTATLFAPESRPRGFYHHFILPGQTVSSWIGRNVRVEIEGKKKSSLVLGKVLEIETGPSARSKLPKDLRIVNAFKIETVEGTVLDLKAEKILDIFVEQREIKKEEFHQKYGNGQLISPALYRDIARTGKKAAFLFRSHPFKDVEVVEGLVLEIPNSKLQSYRLQLDGQEIKLVPEDSILEMRELVEGQTGELPRDIFKEIKLPELEKSDERPSMEEDEKWLWAGRSYGFHDRDKVGKWLIFVPVERLDQTWKLIREETLRGRLGGRSKTATAVPDATARDQNVKVICVYTRDFTDLEDVRRVRARLRELGFTEPLHYKTDVTTRAGIYSKFNNGKVSTYYE